MHDPQPGPLTSGDRRAANRHVSVLVLAKVIADGVAQLCRVRDISPGGMLIEARTTLHPDQPLTTEFRSSRQVQGTVRWVDGQRAGIAFDAPVEVELLLGHADHGALANRPRPPRFERKAHATVTGNRGTWSGQLLNISLTGACLGDATAFRPHEPVVVEIAGLAPRSAEVVWTHDDEMGVHFLRPIELDMFNTWLTTQPDA